MISRMFYSLDELIDFTLLGGSIYYVSGSGSIYLVL